MIDIYHGACIREIVNIHGLPGQDVLFTIIASQLLDYVDDESVEHLSDCSNVTLEKYGDGPVIVTGHGVQEPSTGRRGAVQLLGQHLHPLDDVQLLLGVDERLQEEGRGEPGGHDGNVIRGPIRVLVECCRQILDHLPHKVEICVVKDVVILNKIPIILPDPFLQVRRQTDHWRIGVGHSFARGQVHRFTGRCLCARPRRRHVSDTFIKQHLGTVCLLIAQIKKL